jgi:hypothetical protein
MALNHSAVFTAIRTLVASDLGVEECMDRVISLCSQMVHHPDWEAFRSIDYAADVARRQHWIAETVQDDPPTEPIAGLWFGYFNPVNGGRTSADIRFAGTTAYDPSDDQLLWTAQATYFPVGSAARSAALHQLYRHAYSSGAGLGNTAEWPLGLAFVAVATRALLTADILGAFPVPPERLGVAAGFDGGDMLKLGELTEAGFQVDALDP